MKDQLNLLDMSWDKRCLTRALTRTQLNPGFVSFAFGEKYLERVNHQEPIAPVMRNVVRPNK